MYIAAGRQILLLSLCLAFAVHAIAFTRLADISPADGQSIRDFTLRQKRTDLRGSSHRFDYVWAVVLETGDVDGVVTIVAFADGSASLSTSLQKGGYTSAGHPGVIKISQEVVQMALDNPRWFARAADLGPPGPGQVRMFAVGAWGLRATATMPLDEVSEAKHRYYALWAELHDLGQLLKFEPQM